jgi:predicted AAA+ superfamily ATPase
VVIPRKYNQLIKRYLSYFPVIGIVGPRQVGKTTLVKEFLKSYKGDSLYLDLELDTDLLKLYDPERFFIENRDKLVVVDEIQRKAELFPLFRALVDKDYRPGKYIILGSASPDLIRESSESLAGRIIYITIHPFDMHEIRDKFGQNELWFKGGFPRSLLAPDDSLTRDWIRGFVQTYLQRDLPLLGLKVSPLLTRRLWAMLAHLNGQVINYSLLSKSLEVSSPTIKSYIDFFENAFLVRRVYPYIKNTRKRIVKSPKIYLTDTGILHYLLNIFGINDLYGYPASGNSWEAFCVQQIVSSLPENAGIFFYRSQDGAECDLVIESGGKPGIGAEIKFSNSPVISKGNFIAMNDIQAKVNFIITPGSDDFPVKNNIRVCSLEKFIFDYIPALL